eukprot:TRINITY_DN4703_c0_g1_i10.p1 TRINITY_DN4703_c0_g1~~TRINITY_DN4703_c0_g1_i10.p1  ORF type:complete len:170 (+),score=44.66 TRINITY_DN4703_c0_g1_i10:51-560(+)
MAVPRITAVLMKSGIKSQFVKVTSLTAIGSQRHMDFSTTPAAKEKFFTEKHEWVDVNGSIGIVGVSKYAADALGDVVYAQLPEVGDDVEKGADAGVLESVKAASEVYSPVSGKVTEKNVAVEDGPAIINQSPENEGWLYKLELSNLDELKELMNQEAYEKFLESVSDDH